MTLYEYLRGEVRLLESKVVPGVRYDLGNCCRYSLVEKPPALPGERGGGMTVLDEVKFSEHV